MNIILLGAPGSGKGTQAQFICRQLNIPTISTGNIMREAMREGSPLGQKIKTVMESGGLVPDEIVIDVLLERIAQPDCAQGFLLDGFPRTLAQAEALRDHAVKVDYVIEIVVTDDVILQRMTGRRVHPTSGRTYHILYQPPQIADQDDVTGEPLVQRDDDQEETVRHRLKVYHDSTVPLVHYYKQRVEEDILHAPRFITIDGQALIDVVQKQIVQAVPELSKV